LVPPYFFLASVGNRADFDPTTAPSTYPNLYKNVFVGNSYVIPMATSVIATINGLFSNDASFSAALRSDHWNATLNSGAGGYERVGQFGFNPLHGAQLTTAQEPLSWEDVLTASQSFYRNGYGPLPGAGTTDNTYYTLDCRTIPGATSGTNSLSFQLNPSAAQYFATGSNARLPYYRLSKMKIEYDEDLNGNGVFDAGEDLNGNTAFDSALNSNHVLQTVAPGYTIDVNAFVYAQEGSWFVIPGVYFDEHVKPGYVDLLSSSGTYNGTQDPGENLDLDRDGSISRAEKAAVYRFYRYNYKIKFSGAIMENQTAAVRSMARLLRCEVWEEKMSTAIPLWMLAKTLTVMAF
jgi:hypothetical protein